MRGVLEGEAAQHFLDGYESYRSEVRKGEHGKTAQYIMQSQHIIHTAIQEDNYDLRTDA